MTKYDEFEKVARSIAAQAVEQIKDESKRLSVRCLVKVIIVDDHNLLITEDQVQGFTPISNLIDDAVHLVMERVGQQLIRGE
jgi:hypothetical protein